MARDTQAAAPGRAKAEANGDPDLQRASDLIELHEQVKLRYQQGRVEQDLQRARDEVDHIHRLLSGQRGR